MYLHPSRKPCGFGEDVIHKVTSATISSVRVFVLQMQPTVLEPSLNFILSQLEKKKKKRHDSSCHVSALAQRDEWVEKKNTHSKIDKEHKLSTNHDFTFLLRCRVRVKIRNLFTLDGVV